MAELAPTERRDLIAKYVDDAKINWAHIAIAQLIKHGYVDRVLTTNFDPLVVRACALIGAFPAVYDFAASQVLKPADIPGEAVFYLHGQRTGFALMNTPEECDAHSKLLEPLFRDAGQGRAWVVVGYSETAVPGVSHAFVWTAGGGMTDLGTLGGAVSDAFAVNNSFEIVGATSGAPTPFTDDIPFVWDPVGGMQGMLELSTIIAVPNASAAAAAVNGSGQAAGVSTWLPSGPDRHAVLWSNPVAPPSVIFLPYAPNCVIPPVVSYIPKKFLNDGILSRPGFDATQIDPNTVTIGDGFGHGRASNLRNLLRRR